MGRRLWKTEHRKRKWNIADIFAEEFGCVREKEK